MKNYENPKFQNYFAFFDPNPKIFKNMENYEIFKIFKKL